MTLSSVSFFTERLLERATLAMVEQKRIDSDEAILILEISEGHFADVKRAEIAPAKLSESISAFANAAGGELYIGIAEVLVGDGTEKAALPIVVGGVAGIACFPFG